MKKIWEIKSDMLKMDSSHNAAYNSSRNMVALTFVFNYGADF